MNNFELWALSTTAHFVQAWKRFRKLAIQQELEWFSSLDLSRLGARTLTILGVVLHF